MGSARIALHAPSLQPGHADHDRLAADLDQLRISLERAGQSVVLASAADHVPNGTTVVVCFPDDSVPLDPSLHLGPGVALVACIDSFPTAWIRRHGLAWFDVVICRTEALAREVAVLAAGEVVVAAAVDDVSAAVCGLATSSRRPRQFAVLGFQPNFWNHPYVQKLYQSLGPHVRAVPVGGPADLLDKPGLAHRPHAFHLQWTSQILRRASDAAHAEALVDDYLFDLDRFRSTGAAFVWTIHNVLPHDTPFPAPERRLRAELARRADAIHVLTAATTDAVAPLYDLPAERVTVIPYVEDAVIPLPRSEARARLGLADDATIYLAFGRVRPYKRLAALLAAFARHRREQPDAMLLIAGHLERFAGSRRLRLEASLRRGVVARFGHVAEEDVSLLFAAADAVVIPYETLNSGVAVTAMAHGCAVAAPDGGAARDVVGELGGVLFDPDTSMVAALDRLHEKVAGSDLRRDLVERASTRSSLEMAVEFADLVRRTMADRTA